MPEKFEHLCVGGPYDGKMFASDRPFFVALKESPVPITRITNKTRVADMPKQTHYERVALFTNKEAKVRYVFAPSTYKLEDIIVCLLEGYKGSDYA